MSDSKTDSSKPLVKLIFDGVIAAGPTPPAGGGEKQGPFFAVMARAVRRRTDRSKTFPKEKLLYTNAHVPTIFTRAKPTEDSRPPDRILRVSQNDDRKSVATWYMWHPLRERLEFRFDRDATPGPLVYRSGEGIQTFDGGGGLKGDPVFYGVDKCADMTRIFPKRSDLLDGLLSADPGVNSKVEAQVLVPRGEVVGAAVPRTEGEDARPTGPFDVHFAPVQGGIGPQRPLVPNVAVTNRASTIDIRSYSLDSGEELDTIKFELNEATNIWVSNGDPTDIQMKIQTISMKIAGEPAQRESNQKSFLKTLRDKLPILKDLADDELRAHAAVVFSSGGHHAVFGDTGDDSRSGNVDLDFEIYYSLLKNAELTLKSPGLPIPNLLDPDMKFDGPDCYITLCNTDDRLKFKSNDPK